jgi:tetratricopeptide (TPR) repeat protein
VRKQTATERSSDPYSVHSIRIRSNSDLVVAKYLLDVINNVRDKKMDDAERAIGEARRLTPDYFEVHRVEAYLRFAQGNFAKARTAYETAIELEPSYAPLHVWYGLFMIQALHDCEAALEQFERALKIDPTAVQVQLEIARTYLNLKRFEDAEKMIGQLIGQTGLSERDSVKVETFRLHYFWRLAEYMLSQHRETEALKCLERLLEVYMEYPNKIRDSDMLKQLKNALPVTIRCSRSFEGMQYRSRANRVRKLLEDKTGVR